jgi:hypothetical protein
VAGESDPAADTLRFVDTVTEADAAKDRTVVIPALLLAEKVIPLIRSLSAITDDAEQISVWRPIIAFCKLKRIRPRWNAERVKAAAMLDHCYDRLKEPVERGSSADNAWFQGWSAAIGTSVDALHGGGEVLDRKSAHSLASLSLYIALISLITSIVIALP